MGENHDSPIATNGSKAIGSVNDDSTVGMDNANVVSHPMTPPSPRVLAAWP